MGPFVLASMRAVHVLAGSFWFGAAVLTAAHLIPAVRTTGPAGGQVMGHIVRITRLPVWMNSAMALTLLSGAVLYWWLSGGMAAEWLRTGAGRTYTVGALLSIAAAITGATINAPTARRLGQIGARIQAGGGPPDPALAGEVQRLQARLLLGAQVGALLLGLSTVAMAIARYA